ncbi:MAG: hypothetical protein AB1467_05930 [Candidatus Diapherotrites archaeon]
MPLKSVRVRARRVNQRKSRKFFALMKMHGIDDFVLSNIRNKLLDRFAYDPAYLNLPREKQKKMMDEAISKEIKKIVREKVEPEEMPKSRILSLPEERLAEKVKKMKGTELKELLLFADDYLRHAFRNISKFREDPSHVSGLSEYRLEARLEKASDKYRIIKSELKRRHYIM